MFVECSLNLEQKTLWTFCLYVLPLPTISVSFFFFFWHSFWVENNILNFVIQHCHSWALIEHFRNEKHGNSFLCLRVFASAVHHSSFPSKTIIAIFHFTQSTFLCANVLYHCTIFKASFGQCWVLGCSQKDNILISFISGGAKLAVYLFD